MRLLLLFRFYFSYHRQVRTNFRTSYFSAPHARAGIWAFPVHTLYLCPHTHTTRTAARTYTATAGNSTRWSSAAASENNMPISNTICPFGHTNNTGMAHCSIISVCPLVKYTYGRIGNFQRTIVCCIIITSLCLIVARVVKGASSGDSTIRYWLVSFFAVCFLVTPLESGRQIFVVHVMCRV